jgi:hypothetical protein
MGDTTRRQQANGRLRAAFEFLFAISAGVAGLVGIAYFLFAPRLAIGTASPECDALSNPSACTPPPYYSLVETTFSPGWGIYFTLLALLFASIPVMAILHIHTRAPLWRWALVVVAALILFGTAPLNDSLLVNSPIAVLQDGISLWPGIILSLLTAAMALLDRRRPVANAKDALAIQG